MSTAVQRRRGTTAQHASFAGLNGELTVDTDKEVVVVHDGTTAGGYPQMRENGSNSALALGSAGTPSLKFAGDTNTGIYSPGADQLALSTNGTGRLFIDASGNVGIGAPSSITGLELSENIQIKYSGVNSEPDGARYLTFNNTDTTLVNDQPLGGISWVNNDADATAGQAAFVKAYTQNNTGAAYLSFGTGSQNAATERLRITSAGLVGIGVSSPLSMLDVQGTAATGERLIIGTRNNDAGTNVALDFYTGTTSANRARIEVTRNGAAATGDMRFYTQITNTLSEKMRIDYSGRLLVGTSSGSNEPRLVVVGNQGNNNGSGWLALGRGESASTITGNEGIGTISFTDNAQNEFAHIAAYADAAAGAGDYPGRLVFSTTADGESSPTEAMRITSQGILAKAVTSTKAIANNTTETILTVGSALFATVHFDVFFRDDASRQGIWAGQYSLFVSDANGTPGVSYYLNEHWQDVGSAAWVSPVVTVAVDASGNVTFNATNANSDMNGTVYVYVTMVSGFTPSITTYS